MENEYVIDKSDYTPKVIWDGMSQRHIAIRLESSNDDKFVMLYGKALRRFLYFMGTSKRRFVNMMHKEYQHTSRNGRVYDRKMFIGLENAQNFLQQKYPNATVQKFKVLDSGNGVAQRITSEKYIGVPHEFIQGTIERRLNAEDIRFEKTDTFDGMSVAYRFTDAVSDGIQSGISYLNMNSGDKSLKFYGGAVVLVCSNGMMSGQASSEIRLLHKHDLNELGRLIESRISDQLKNLEILPKQFLKLKEYQITKAEADVLVHSLPMAKYMQDAIWDRLFQKSKLTANGEMDWDGTMWGVYMAATYIASHVDKLQRSTNKTANMTVEMAEKLSVVETFVDVWDKREKLMQQDKARKEKEIEVLGH